MKAIILFIFLGYFAKGYAQDVNDANKKVLEERVATLKNLVCENVGEINQSVDIATIHLLASDIQQQSALLIEEVKLLYNINDDYLMDYNQNTALAIALPDMAVYYNTVAQQKLLEGLSRKTPVYYSALLDINSYAGKIRRTDDVQKIKKMSLKISEQQLQIL